MANAKKADGDNVFDLEQFKAKEQPADPFDLESLKVSNFTNVQVEPMLLRVAVRKPNKEEFFRVHPGDDYSTGLYTMEKREGNQTTTYLVAPMLANQLGPQLAGSVRETRIYTCVSKKGVPFLYPLKLPIAEQGRTWYDSAVQILEQAKKSWVRMYSNQDAAQYEATRAMGDLGEPAFPDKTFNELLQLAFKDALIQDANHDVIRELLGEI